MTRWIAPVLLALPLLAACGAVKSNHTFGPPADPGVKIQGEVTELNIKDTRKFVGDDEVVVPVVTIMGDDARGEERITGKTLREMRARAATLFTGVGPKASILVTVRAAETSYEPGLMTEDLRARALVDVEVRDSAGNVIAEHRGAAKGEWNGLKVTDAEASEILQYAVKVAFEKALVDAERMTAISRALAASTQTP